MTSCAPATSTIVNGLLFDYASYSADKVLAEGRQLPPKLLRWLAKHHPDNRTRKVFLQLTNVNIGDDTVVNAGFVVSDDYRPLLTIGKRVAISPNVTVICTSSPNNSRLVQLPGFTARYVKEATIVIDDDAWIGSGAVLLPGTRVGPMSIVGAGAIVTQDVPPFSIVAGCPARIVGRVSDNDRVPSGQPE